MMRMIRASATLLIAVQAACWISGSPAVQAASATMLTVTPMKLTFDNESRRAAVTVRNDGQGNITGRIAIFEWSQDAAGRDDYHETEDIVYFPKVMTLAEGEQRIIRLGYQGEMPAREKAYRLIIGVPSDAGHGAFRPGERAAMADLTIFAHPAVLQAGALLEQVALAKSALTVVVRNAGNVHLLVTAVSVRGVAADGHEAFSREIAGSYVLGGAFRSFGALVPQEDCGKLSHMDIQVITDSFQLNRTLNVRKDMCAP